MKKAEGLRYSQGKGFSEHVSETIVWGDNDDLTREKVFEAAGYKSTDDDVIFGELFHNGNEQYCYLLDVWMEGCPFGGILPKGLDLVFFENKVDLMEFLIRISPVYTASAVAYTFQHGPPQEFVKELKRAFRLG